MEPTTVEPGAVVLLGAPFDEASTFLRGAAQAPARSLEVPVVGADVVELNPTRDPSGITAALAAKLVKEIAALMLRPE